MQVRFATGLTGEEYARQEAWRAASLPCYPFHPEGGCGFARHTAYERVSPPGCLVARWYCPTAHTTISLLFDFLCSRLTGTLAEVEAVVSVAEAAPSLEAASEVVRPEAGLRGALRWLRRRVRLVHAGLAPALGLLPSLLARCEPTVTTVRPALGAEVTLVCLRGAVAGHLAALPRPLGFGPRPLRRRASSTASQTRSGAGRAGR